MARKIAKRVLRYTKYSNAFEDDTLTDDSSKHEPQEEEVQIALPGDGEVQLEHDHILSQSVYIINVDTEEEFSETEDENPGEGEYYLDAEQGVVFFGEEDGKNGVEVSIKYKWQDEPGTAVSQEEEPETLKSEEDEDSDDEVVQDSEEESDSSEEVKDVKWSEDEDKEEGKKNQPAKSIPSDNMWHINQNWYKWAPITKTIKVNNSHYAKLEKGVVGKITVKNNDTGETLHVISSPLSKKKDGPKTLPGAGQVVYCHENGTLYWGDPSSAGTTYVVEYFLKGKTGKPVTMEGTGPDDKEKKTEEYNLLEQLKSQAENLWTNLLDHPDPAFVTSKLIPIVEDELISAREKLLNSNSRNKDRDLANFPDLTDEFIKLEQLMAKREKRDEAAKESRGDPETQAAKVSIRAKTREFIQKYIAPKLSRLNSLANLLAEHVYEMQSSPTQDEDFPEFKSSGSRVLDPRTLDYTKRVSQSASSLDREVLDFSSYYTGLLVSWIVDPDTYYPPTSQSKGNAKKKGSRWNSIRMIFEKANIGMPELHHVALEAFRKAILDFDRDTRDQTKIPDPKDFRVHGSPMIQNRVRNALKRVFDKYQREQVSSTETREGNRVVTIPSDGAEVRIDAPGLRLQNLTIKGIDGTLFTPANGTLFDVEDVVDRGHKQPRAKIVIPKQRGEHVQLSVTDPETGEKLNRYVSPGTPDADDKTKVANDKTLFYYSPSSGTIWVSSKFYSGKQLLVESPRTQNITNEIGKNQYIAYPSSGAIQFSTKNKGEEVAITFSQTIRSQRQVNPIVSSEDEYEGTTNVVDLAQDVSVDPDTMEAAESSRANVESITEVVSGVLDSNDPRINPEDVILIRGLLGIGEPDEKSITLKEVATRAPFNVDPSDKSKMQHMETRRERAFASLLEVLKSNAKSDPEARSMLKPLWDLLYGDKAKSKSEVSLDKDRFLSYLRGNAKDTEKCSKFKGILENLIISSNLSQEEENTLRWMWAIHGSLRRDASHTLVYPYSSIPNATAPARSVTERLHTIAKNEFGLAPEGSTNKVSLDDVKTVQNVYNQALEKVTTKFDHNYSKPKYKEIVDEKYPDFTSYFGQQAVKQVAQDEISRIERGESLKPSKEEQARRKELQTKKAPTTLFSKLLGGLYSTNQGVEKGVDKDELQATLKELEAADKKGRSLDNLIQKKSQDVEKLKEMGTDRVLMETEKEKAAIDELGKEIRKNTQNINKTESDLQEAMEQKKTLRRRAMDEADADSKVEVQKQKRTRRICAEIIAAIDAGTLKKLLSPKNLREMGRPVPNNEEATELAARDQATYSLMVPLLKQNSTELTASRARYLQILNKAREAVKEEENKVIALNEEVHPELTKVNHSIATLRSSLEKVKEVKAQQEVQQKENQEKLRSKSVPMEQDNEELLGESKSYKRLHLLEQIKKFLSEHEELQRSDGSFNLTNMFEVTEPGESKDYSPMPTEGVEGWEREEHKELSPSGTVVPNEPKSLHPETEEEKAQEKAREMRTKVLNPPSYKVETNQDEKTKLSPRQKEPPTEVNRSLAFELMSASIPFDPEETPENHTIRVQNFYKLLSDLQKHFEQGKDISSFSPSFPEDSTLFDQDKVINRIHKYLTENSSDLKKAKGVWDLSGMGNQTIRKPVTPPKPDLSNTDKAIEALVNAQPTLASKDEAKILNVWLNQLSSGTHTMKEIRSGLRKVSDTASLQLLSRRLEHFLQTHENLVLDDGKWNLESLYLKDGSKFPSIEEYNGSRSLNEQMGPVVNKIQSFLKEEVRDAREKSGPKVQVKAVEPISDTAEKVNDVLETMFQLAQQRYSLEQMEEHFSKEDQTSSRPYSLRFIFSQIKNQAQKLNQAFGLANMHNDRGLSDVFGPGASPGTPSEKDEVVTVRNAPVDKAEKEEDVSPADSKTEAFKQMAKSMKLSDKEANQLLSVLTAVQNRTAVGGTTSEILSVIHKKIPHLSPLLMKFYKFIGENKGKFKSEIPGVMDVSAFTGVPFEHQDLDITEEEDRRPEILTDEDGNRIDEDGMPYTEDDGTEIDESLGEDETSPSTRKLSPEFQQAKDYLKTVQDEDEEGSIDSADPLSGVWDRLVEDYYQITPEDEEYSVLLELMTAAKTHGVEAIRNHLQDTGQQDNAHMFNNMIAYLKEMDVAEDEVQDIQLPALQSVEEPASTEEAPSLEEKPAVPAEGEDAPLTLAPEDEPREETSEPLTLAPEDSPSAPTSTGPRGRLPHELGSHRIGPKVFDLVTTNPHTNISNEELLAMMEEVPTVENMTYQQVRDESKKPEITPITRVALLKYCKGLASYLRQLQSEAVHTKAETPATPVTETPATAPAEMTSKVQKLHGLLAGDKNQAKRIRRIRGLMDLEVYTEAEMTQAVNALPLSLTKKKNLLESVHPEPKPEASLINEQEDTSALELDVDKSESSVLPKESPRDLVSRRNKLAEAAEGYDWTMLHTDSKDHIGPLTITHTDTASSIMLGPVILRVISGSPSGEELFNAIGKEREALESSAKEVWNKVKQTIMQMQSTLSADTTIPWPVLLKELAKAGVAGSRDKDAVVYCLSLLREGALDPGWSLVTSRPTLEQQDKAVVIPSISNTGTFDRAYGLRVQGPSAKKTPIVAPIKTAPVKADPASPKYNKELERLLTEKALKWLTDNKLPTADYFKTKHLAKRPDLFAVWDRIAPAVQQALDALNNEEDDVDLSDI